MQNFQEVQLALNQFRKSLPYDFYDSLAGGCGIILGTGLSHLAQSLVRNPLEIPFSSLPGFPCPGVDSHKGVFYAGRGPQGAILAQCGRVHLYEGRSPADICMGIRIMKGLGIKKLILTNSAGALNPLFNAGSLMLATDIINHTGLSPLTGTNYDGWGERFPDMSSPFSENLCRIAQDTALKNSIPLEKGVYIGVHGPEMETPAETRMYRQWGADAIGMSTVLEVIAARHLGMDCISISCLTNKNLPDCMEPAPLEIILEKAREALPLLKKLLTGILEQI